jgi:hypothetical protein
MPHYQFVEESESLVPELQKQGQLGIDTEFMRERTYFAQLCLTQISTPHEIWCVDPLSGHPQDAFWKEMLTHDWVVHSARQDIEVIYQLAGAMPVSIFDTQVAAGLLGHPAQMGYATSRFTRPIPARTGPSGRCATNTSSTLLKTSSTCCQPAKSCQSGSKTRAGWAGHEKTRNGCSIRRFTISGTVRPSKD